MTEVAEEYKGIVYKVCLIAPSTLDHPKIKDLLSELVNMGFMVSPSSTRADRLDEETVEILVKGGLKSLTIAPEVGSDNVRNVINKELSEEDVINAIKICMDKGIKSFKFYFMIGLPNEDFDDVKGIVDLVERIRSMKVNVSVSINPFVPKPHTPLQWCPYAGVDDVKTGLRFLKEKREYLIEELSKICEVNVESAERFAIQTILSRGDKDVGRIFDFKPSLRVAEKLGLTKYLKSITLDSELPWDFIDHDYKKEKLKEFIRACESQSCTFDCRFPRKD